MTPHVLVVLPSETKAGVSQSLHSCNASVLEASCCEDAEPFLAASPICLILTTPTLPDGSWRRVLTMALREGLSPQLVLLMPEVDGGWVDLRERGAWEVLAAALYRVRYRRSGTGSSVVPGKRRMSLRPAAAALKSQRAI